MKNNIFKISFWCVLALLFAAVVFSYCTIYFYPPLCTLEEISPSSKTEEMVIDASTAPTKACHASTLAFFNDELYCAWFGGTQEGNPDVTIFLTKRTTSGWTTPQDMSDIKNIAHYNPVLFAHNQTLYLYYKIGTAPSNWKTYFRQTSDGENWTQEKLLVENDVKGRGAVKNKPIVLSNGTVLAPASYEYKNWFPRSFADISTDMQTWTESESISGALGVLLIQPTFIELDNGHVVAYTRSNAGRIFESHSYNYGRSWTRSHATGLLNNNSGIDAVKLSDGTIALAHNPNGENWGARSPLVIALSYDNGKTFTKQITLETVAGEFSYPSIITKDNKLFVSYTYNREFIKFCEIEI